MQRTVEDKRPTFFKMLVTSKLEPESLEKLRVKTTARLEVHNDLNHSAFSGMPDKTYSNFIEQTNKEMQILNLLIEYQEFMKK